MSAELLAAAIAGCLVGFAFKVLQTKCKDIRGNITIVLAPPCHPAEEAAIMRARILLNETTQ